MSISRSVYRLCLVTCIWRRRAVVMKGERSIEGRKEEVGVVKRGGGEGRGGAMKEGGLCRKKG